MSTDHPAARSGGSRRGRLIAASLAMAVVLPIGACASAPGPTGTPGATVQSVAATPSPTAWPSPPADGSATVTINDGAYHIPGHVDRYKTEISIKAGRLWFINSTNKDHLIVEGRGGERAETGSPFALRLKPGEWGAVPLPTPGYYRLTDQLQPLVELAVTVS